MDKKEIIELAKRCLNTEDCESCEYIASEPMCEEIFAKFIVDNFAEKEPEPEGTDVSLTREETLSALQACGFEHDCENCPITEKRTGYCVNIMATNALHYLKEKEPAPAATGTSSNKDMNNTLYLDDTAKLKICQDALLNIGDRIAECADGDEYILGYVNAVLDVIGLKAGEHND